METTTIDNVFFRSYVFGRFFQSGSAVSGPAERNNAGVLAFETRVHDVSHQKTREFAADVQFPATERDTFHSQADARCYLQVFIIIIIFFDTRFFFIYLHAVSRYPSEISSYFRSFQPIVVEMFPEDRSGLLYERWAIRFNGNRKYDVSIDFRGYAEYPCLSFDYGSSVNFPSTHPGCERVERVAARNTSRHRIT